MIREDSDWNCEKFNFELLSDAAVETSYVERVKGDEEYLGYLMGVNSGKLERVVKDECME